MADLRDRLRALRRSGEGGVPSHFEESAASSPPLDAAATAGSGGTNPSAVATIPPGRSGLPANDLPGLEAALLGAPGEGLSLKDRLERLVAAAARARPRRPEPVSIEDLVPGRSITNERGRFYLVEYDRHLESRYGDVPLSRFRAVTPGSVAVVAGDPELHSFDLGRAVFLDTETTGLAGGAGTAAFLVGVGFIEGDRFVVRQYFMRDYDEEAALLHELAALLATFPFLVTYNGKAFDLPLLESRYRLNRTLFPAASAQHLDLLPPARRLWKLRLESCRLQSLEWALLGMRRSGDVPGEEIPRIYFDYVRRRDARAIARVLDHNRLDVLSLAALTAFACHWVHDEGPEDPRDAYSLGRVFERARLYDRSDQQYRRALKEETGPLRTAALLRLAGRAKRNGDHGAACDLWEEAAAAGSWLALRELAVHHEHRSRDLGAALAAVERGLEADSADQAACARARAEFERRKARLFRKIGFADGAGAADAR
jgi:uncharacterized protein